MQNENKETQISLIEVLKSFLKKWWIIALSSVLCALIAFVYLFKFVPQEYTSSIRFYVNNKQSTSIGGTDISISGADISSSRSLVDSYAVILTSNTTLESIFNFANIMDEEDPSKPKYKTTYDDNKNFEYDYDYLRGLISVEAVNDTEIFSVSFTCESKADARTLAQATIETFPELVESIISGSEVSVVDYPKTITEVEKGYAKYCIIAFLIGFVLSCGVIFVYDFFINDTITSSDYISSGFPSIPLLAVVPDTNVETRSKYGKYGKYYYYKHRKDYYQNYYESKEKGGEE